MTAAMDHPFVASCCKIFSTEHPDVRFIEPNRARNVLRRRRPAVLHLQWIDVVLRREGRLEFVVHASKFVAMLLILRLRRVGVVWTCHNLIGKAHRRRRSDRLLRSLLVLLADAVIVLNAAATPLVEKELLVPVRRRFRRLVVVVPMPALDVDHGPPTEKSVARRELGISTDLPLLAYVPGANQHDLTSTLLRDADGYELLVVDRLSTRKSVQQVDGGWMFSGRPSDVEYGRILCAADAVLLTDPSALGSGTLCTSVRFRRFVISPKCAAVAELEELGGAVTIDWPATSTAIRSAISSMAGLQKDRPFELYESKHTPTTVSAALEMAYRRAGFDK